MRLVLVAAVAVFVSGSAQAQTSRTQCSMIGTQLYCETRSQPTNSYQSAYQQGYAASAARSAAFEQAINAGRAAREAEQKAELEAIFMQAVGKRIAEGDCQGAYNIITRGGRLDLVDEVERLCPRPAPPQ